MDNPFSSWSKLGSALKAGMGKIEGSAPAKAEQSVLHQLPGMEIAPLKMLTNPGGIPGDISKGMGVEKQGLNALFGQGQGQTPAAVPGQTPTATPPEQASPGQLAYQAFFANTILPYLTGLNKDTQNSANQFAGLENSMLGQLPPQYRGAEQINIARDQNNAHQMAGMMGSTTANSDLLSQLLSGITRDIAAQQAAQKAAAQNTATTTGALPTVNLSGTG